MLTSTIFNFIQRKNLIISILNAFLLNSCKTKKNTPISPPPPQLLGKINLICPKIDHSFSCWIMSGHKPQIFSNMFILKKFMFHSLSPI